VSQGDEVLQLRRVRPEQKNTKDLDAVEPFAADVPLRFQLSDEPSDGPVLGTRFWGRAASADLKSGRSFPNSNFASWWSKPAPPCPKYLTYCDTATYLGFGTIVYRDYGVFDGSFQRYSRPNRGLEKIAVSGGLCLDRAIHVEKQIEGPCFCLGDIPGHFGHFMLEVLPRLWGIAWAIRRGIPVYAFRPPPPRPWPWQLELLDLAGVDLDKIVWLHTPCRISKVFLASPLYRLHSSFHPEFRDFCRELGMRALSRIASTPPRERLFLGRGKLKRRRRLTNEKEVVSLFERYGFEPVYPETMGVTEQIAMAARAKHLAGPIGSQMFLSLFQRGGVSNYIMASHRFCLPDDALIAAMNGIECNYLFSDDIDAGQKARDEKFKIAPADVDRILSESLR
jgi:Glycosyltransferase 61